MNNIGHPKRKFPRRAFHGKIGVLCAGEYCVSDAQIIGEGGLQIVSPFDVPAGAMMVLTFTIPMGPTLSLKAQVKNKIQDASSDALVLGLEFVNVSFDLKRTIRTYVAARMESEVLV